MPVEVETAGGDISRLVRGFPGLRVDSVDGTDFLASVKAMREAAAHVRARKGPALVHAHVIRPYSHSLSDDEKLYKTPAEREDEARRDPIRRLLGVPPQPTNWPRPPTSPQSTTDIDRELDDAAQAALKAAEAGEEHRGALTSSRPTSIRHQQRSKRRRGRKARPTRW